MARKTLRKIAALLATAQVATPGLVPEIKLSAKDGDKSLKFTVTVKVGPTVYDVAGDNGKVKTYAGADDVVKAVAKYIPTNTGSYTLDVETGLLLVSALPSDLKKDAASKVVKYGAIKTAQNAVLAGIVAEIALMAGWENGNALQVARLNESNAQKAAVEEDIDEIDALIAHYTTIANS